MLTGTSYIYIYNWRIIQQDQVSYPYQYILQKYYIYTNNTQEDQVPIN